MITIVTLYRAGMEDYFVGAVSGKISNDDRINIAKRLKLYKDGDDDDTLSFTEIPLHKDVNKLNEVVNISDGGTITASSLLKMKSIQAK